MYIERERSSYIPYVYIYIYDYACIYIYIERERCVYTIIIPCGKKAEMQF